MLKTFQPNTLNQVCSTNHNSLQNNKNLNLHINNSAKIILLNGVNIGKIKPFIKNSKYNFQKNEIRFKDKTSNYVSSISIPKVPEIMKNQEEVSEYIKDFVKYNSGFRF